MAINFGQILSGVGQVILGSTNQTATTNTPLPVQQTVATTGLSTGAIIGITFGIIVLIGGIVTVVLVSNKK